MGRFESEVAQYAEGEGCGFNRATTKRVPIPDFDQTASYVQVRFLMNLSTSRYTRTKINLVNIQMSRMLSSMVSWRLFAARAKRSKTRRPHN